GEVLGESGRYRPDPATLADLGGRAWVHGAGLAGGVEGFVELRRSGARLSYDFSHASSPERMAELCPHLEVAFLSAPGGAAGEARDLAESALAAGAATAVVTRGRHGSLALAGSIAGGVGSGTRSHRSGYLPVPVFVRSGRGAHVTDEDGNDFIDYVMGQGPLILGHRPPAVIDAVTETLRERGSLFSLAYDL